MRTDREAMEFDVVIVGGGPAGLSAAIRLKQNNPDISVCLIEKGAEIGAHILSGAVMDPKAITELFPDWKERGAPLHSPVTQDQFLFLSESSSTPCPNWLLPQCFTNKGNYVISLGQVCRWLAEQAEVLGVEIYPGFAGTEILFNEHGAVRGIATGDFGLTRNGEQGNDFQPGMELIAHYTLFAEGCRGHLGQQLESHFQLRDGADPQTYGLGIKECWEIPAEQHESGRVIHTAGWPLHSDTYGGGFLYHYENTQKQKLVAIGLVVGLGYANPYLSPFEEMQRLKTHPHISKMLKGGTRLSYGARALAAGGLQSLPKLSFPGGALLGDDAGFLIASRIKGSHAAIKSGMLAADSVTQALAEHRANDTLEDYAERFKISWLYEELHQSRNFKPLMSMGLKLGAFLFGMDQIIFRGKAPWTLHNTADHLKLKQASQSEKINYPKPDGTLTFDRLSSVFLSNTNHEENQPCHLQLIDPAKAISLNLKQYDSPESRYCPAGVYEIVLDAQGAPALQINAQNCVHCKTCDIKDPTQNIKWVTPQGGGGPLYQSM